MQISLDIDDLTDIRLMLPGAMTETVLAAWTLQARPPESVTKHHVRWRKRVAPLVARLGQVRRVMEVQAPPYTLVDLCLPTVGAGSWDEGIERVSALGPAYYKLELSLIAHAIATRPHLQRPVPRWTEQLTEADPRPRADLLTGLALLHKAGIADRDAADHASAQAYLDARTRDLAGGGVKQLLSNLHHTIRWHHPVITVDSPTAPPIDTPSPAGGRGIIIAPSSFATKVHFFHDSEHRRPGLLVVPNNQREVAGGTPQSQHLEQLLGRKRAAVLIQVALRSASTSDLATRCGITAGAVSEHTRVLRECGLITTDRSRRSVHSITPAGAALLRAPRPTDA
ncbi:ArsR/SmtB family transcription factor [Kribbella sp. CA-294648]|uniref:ArsR/SmtB family transcription factor n=1 Tax=Kribbella sp. CA-294648 TaxID=3239948 RepID=UPI003D94DF95